jgi:hypothetical protein
LNFPSLLVLIGFTAAFIISLFPKPQSAKKSVRKTLAKAIDNSAELFIEEIKGFLLKARVDGNAMESDTTIDAQLSQYRTRFLGLVVSFMLHANRQLPQSLITIRFHTTQGKLQAAELQIVNARFEPGLRGPWPRTKYEAMVSRVQELVGGLALLSNSWVRMEGPWAKGLVDDTPFFEPNFVSSKSFRTPS